jgi:hypothetical protein
MPLQPGHEALLRALREQIHGPAAFEIHEHRSVVVAFLEGEVVHAERPHLPAVG